MMGLNFRFATVVSFEFSNLWVLTFHKDKMVDYYQTSYLYNVVIIGIQNSSMGKCLNDLLFMILGLSF